MWLLWLRVTGKVLLIQLPAIKGMKFLVPATKSHNTSEVIAYEYQIFFISLKFLKFTWYATESLKIDRSVYQCLITFCTIHLISIKMQFWDWQSSKPYFSLERNRIWPLHGYFHKNWCNLSVFITVSSQSKLLISRNLGEVKRCE